MTAAMPLPKVVILAFTALITMVNPLAVIPSFIALTDGVSRRTRASVALLASVGCIAVLAVFLLAGNYVFQFFGITVPAFQIMGGVIFLTNALRTLVNDDRRAYNAGGEKRMEDSDVEKAEIDPTSIAIVPLAVPMLSGPGAITSVMVLVNLYPTFTQKFAVIVAVQIDSRLNAITAPMPVMIATARNPKMVRIVSSRRISDIFALAKASRPVMCPSSRSES